MIYSIDTSALLDGWVRYYPQAVFPTVWRKLEQMVRGGTLIATEEVLFELEKKDDDVYKWAKAQQGMFVGVDEEIQRVVAKLLEHNPRLVEERRNRSKADPFVIALAVSKGIAVVTGEKSSTNPSKPRIPNVCATEGIRCISLVEMFKELRWQI